MFLTSIILHKKISCLFLGGVGVFAILKQSVIITWGELDAGRVMSNSRTLLMIIHEKVRNVSARVVTVGKVISSIRTETTQYQILMLYSFMCISWHFLSLMCPRLVKGTARYFAKSYFSVFRMKKNVSFFKNICFIPTNAVMVLVQNPELVFRPCSSGDGVGGPLNGRKHQPSHPVVWTQT